MILFKSCTGNQRKLPGTGEDGILQFKAAKFISVDFLTKTWPFFPPLLSNYGLEKEIGANGDPLPWEPP